MENQYYLFTKEFPSVLTEEEETILIKDKENPKSANKLVERNLRLVWYVSKKFQKTGIDIEDLFSIGVIGLVKAIKCFKPDKGIKLATFSSRCIENEILMFIRKNKKFCFNDSLTDPLYTDNDGSELTIEDILPDKKIRTEEKYENAEMISNTITLALNKMNKRENMVLLLSLSDFGQRKIAEKCKLTQSYVSRILNKVHDKCRSYSKMAVNKNIKYKYVFLCAEEYYDFCVFIDDCPDLQKVFLNLRSFLCGDELSWYDELNVRNEKDYFIMKLPKTKESFLFIARFIEKFETE